MVLFHVFRSVPREDSFEAPLIKNIMLLDCIQCIPAYGFAIPSDLSETAGVEVLSKILRYDFENHFCQNVISSRPSNKRPIEIVYNVFYFAHG